MWEHGNIGQFWKGTREQGPPLGDPPLSRACAASYLRSCRALLGLVQYEILEKVWNLQTDFPRHEKGRKNKNEV